MASLVSDKQKEVAKQISAMHKLNGIVYSSFPDEIIGMSQPIQFGSRVTR
jgi:hypothetical protein